MENTHVLFARVIMGTDTLNVSKTLIKIYLLESGIRLRKADWLASLHFPDVLGTRCSAGINSHSNTIIEGLPFSKNLLPGV